MVKHIVWWTLKEEANGKSAKENAKLFKERAEALNGKIPSIDSLEVSFEFLETTTTEVELILQSTHDNAEALKNYLEHPLHVEFASFAKLVTENRKAIDYYIHN